MHAIDANQAVPAADGVLLATDVYRPDRLPAPAVVTRTPYGRGSLLANGVGWARNGLAYVAQDVRGRYGSGGTWTPYQGERADGRALVEWVHRQPWCDGNVILAGASYGSFTAWAAAVTVPELVRAVISEVPAAGLRPANVDPSGILRLAEYAGWWAEHAESRTSRNGLSAQMLGCEPDLLRHLPVADLGRHLWARVPRWWSAIAPALSAPALSAPAPLTTGDSPAPHDRTGDDLGEGISTQELARCSLPSLHIGGWYDLFLPQTLWQWETAGRDRAPNRPARGLVIGPWGHELSTPASSSAGGREHGPASQLPLGRLQVAWIFDVLAGRDASITKVFLVEGGRWLDRWPASTATLGLQASADGSLLPNPPERPAEHRFTYDPLDPFPSLPRDCDRAPLDARADAVAFRTPPLTTPTAIVGAPTVTMAADTTGPGTDWIVRLVERLGDGRALEVTSGAAAVGPGAATVSIPLGATALLLHPGSRLELQVTSSDFPRLARTPNTGQDRYTTSATRTATQTIHTGPTRGCRVDLPVLEHL